MDLTCNTVVDMVNGKSVVGLRKMFNLTNDLTPEEEEQIRRASPWAFDE